MGGGWGTSHNGIKIGCFWDDIEISADGSQARITNAVIKIYRGVNIADSSNNLSWSGGLITDGSDANINLDGSGTKTIKSCTETWIDLSYTSTINRQFNATLTGCNYAGQNLYANESQTFPKRAYDLPVAPSDLAFTGSLGNFTVTWTNLNSTNAPWTAAELHRFDYETGINTVIPIPNPATDTSISQVVPSTGRYYWLMVVSNTSGQVSSTSTAVTPTPLHTLTMDFDTRLIDQTVNFTIDNNGSVYKSVIYVDGILIQDKTTATTKTYTFAQATWASRLSSVTSKSLVVKLETWSEDGLTLIGDLSYTLTLSLPTPLGIYAPVASVPTIADQTTAVTTAFGSGIYIQNMSVLRITHVGAAGLGATITKKEILVNGLTYDVTVAGYVDVPVTWNTTPTAQSRTTDTRNQVTTSATTGLKGYPYAKPVILNFITQRVDGAGNPTGSGTQVKFTVDVSATSIFSTTERNTMKFDVYLAVNGVKTGPALYSKAANSTLVTIPASVSGVIGTSGTYSKSASYSFILEVNDDLPTSTATRLSSIPTEIVPLSIGPNGISVGKVYDDVNQAVDVIGNVKVTGDLTVTGALSFPAGGISAAAVGSNLDARYFTETEVTNLLNGKAESSHTHDDRYYTESEIDVLLSGKVNNADNLYPKFVTYYLSADSAMLTASNYVSVAFNTKGETSGDFDVTWVGHTFAVPVTGIYEIVLQITWTADSTSGNRQQLLYKNPAQTTLNSSSGPTLLAGGYTGGVMKTQKYAPSSDMTGGIIYWKGLVLAGDRFMPYARTTSSTRVAGGTYDSQVTITLERPM